jgi:PEP-CTERM motif
MKRRILGLLAAVLVSGPAAAIPLTFGDAYDLGQVNLGDLGQVEPGDRLAYANHLIDMAPGTADLFSLQLFQRSLSNPGPGFPNLPDAVLDGAVSGTGTTIDFGLGLYDYLFAQYGLAGAQVWYVGGLSGFNSLPLTDGAFGLGNWTLFAGNHTSVPEPATLALFGLGLAGLRLMRRRRSA